jgi:hypothetical protein
VYVCAWRIAAHCNCVCSYMHKQLLSQKGQALRLAHVLHGQRKKCDQRLITLAVPAVGAPLCAGALTADTTIATHTNPHGNPVPFKKDSHSHSLQQPTTPTVDKHGKARHTKPKAGCSIHSCTAAARATTPTDSTYP